MANPESMPPLIQLGQRTRDHLLRGMLQARPGLATAQSMGVSDVQYGLDALSEERLLEDIRLLWSSSSGGLRLLTEGLSEGGIQVFPSRKGQIDRLLMIDPVDGTRGLMTQKRSAWFLAGLAPESSAPRLSHLEECVLVELPTPRARYVDLLHWSSAQGPSGWTEDLTNRDLEPLKPQPNHALTLEHGFATFNRFTGGALEAIGALQDRFLRLAFPDRPERALNVFEDQFISNGGQMHGLLTGKDLMVADLRPLFSQATGAPLLSSHPYDLLATPLARSLGVVLTDAKGAPLDCTLDLSTPVAWIGWASESLRNAYEPLLLKAIGN